MRHQLFSLVVILTLALVMFIAVVLLQPELLAGIAGRTTTGHISEHFREPQHRVHDLTFGFLMGTAVVGTLAQLRRPSQRPAVQVMALMPIAGLVLATALSGPAVLSFPWVSVGALVLAATVLHPTAQGLVRSLRRVDPVMLALVGLAAGPLLAFASANLDLQRRGVGDHAMLGHYGYMAGFAFTVIGVGLLSSMRVDGGRVTAWVAGALAAAIGITSIVFPDVESRLDLPWAVAAIGWGTVFVASAQRSGLSSRMWGTTRSDL
jgi:hypothetical protein